MTEPISSLTDSLPPSPLHNACTHHFLHPLSWMRPALEQGLLEGRLECPNPKCQAKIGSYAWQGNKCSCGIWICPAFSLQKARVDEITKRGEYEAVQGADQINVTSGRDKGGGIGIRLPPGMRGKGNL
jgi:dual specificity phosphatase 12